MSDAPERIWVENLNANYRHSSNCSLTDPKLDPQDHRVMDEYIIKDTADKEMEKILQPIRDVMKIRYVDSGNTLDQCNDKRTELLNIKQAVYATISIADNK
ncbi:MAG: hypothetical protein HOI47_21615 [Candidatus Scalindua sp.]|nr:hypothetical protein [Candidatus Scalindua sp.]